MCTRHLEGGRGARCSLQGLLLGGPPPPVPASLVVSHTQTALGYTPSCAPLSWPQPGASSKTELPAGAGHQLPCAARGWDEGCPRVGEGRFPRDPQPDAPELVPHQGAVVEQLLRAGSFSYPLSNLRRPGIPVNCTDEETKGHSGQRTQSRPLTGLGLGPRSV